MTRIAGSVSMAPEADIGLPPELDIPEWIVLHTETDADRLLDYGRTNCRFSLTATSNTCADWPYPGCVVKTLG